jgi:hypothetical protein
VILRREERRETSEFVILLFCEEERERRGVSLRFCEERRESSGSRRGGEDTLPSTSAGEYREVGPNFI